jgi:hypothetical protein
MTQRLAVVGLVVLAAFGTNGACDCGASAIDNTPCSTGAQCPTGWLCIDGTCRRPDAGPVDGEDGDAGTEGADGADADGDVVYDITCPDGGVPCAAICCAAGEECRFGSCVTPGECVGDADCGSDSYCEAGACIPYGTGPRPDHNPDCTRIVVAGLFAPTLQCSWEGPPAGDAFPTHIQLLDTPMVVDFDFDGARDTVRPSIVFTSYNGTDGGSEQPTGIIRIVNGRDCVQQASLDLQYTSASSPPAVGDIDGDGRAEVVAYQAGGGLVAFDYDAATTAWGVLWRSHLADGTPYNPTGGSWTGPALHDLDDDGMPEVLRGGLIFDHDGAALGTSLGVSPDGGSYTTIGIGVFPAVADVDADTIPELATGAGV